MNKPLETIDTTDAQNIPPAQQRAMNTIQAIDWDTKYDNEKYLKTFRLTELGCGKLKSALAKLDIKCHTGDRDLLRKENHVVVNIADIPKEYTELFSGQERGRE